MVAAEAEVLFQSNSLLLRNLDLRVLGKSDPPKTEIKQFQVKIMDDQSILRRPCSDGIKIVEVTEVIEN